MRYDEAQDIFNKWHQQALAENAKTVEKELQVCGAGTVVAENHNRSGSPGAPYPQKRSHQQALRQGDERGAGGKHQPH